MADTAKQISPNATGAKGFAIQSAVNGDELRITITERDTLDDYVGTIPISELSAKHRLLADSDLICEAINGAHGDQPGSPGGESESNIVVGIDKRPISGKSTPLWVVNLSCEIMLRKKIVRDELIIFCNGPVPKNDSEKLISTIRALREEVALLNSRIRAVEEENKRLGSRRRLGVVLQSSVKRNIHAASSHVIDLDDGSLWENAERISLIVAPQILALFVLNDCPPAGTYGTYAGWIRKHIGCPANIACVIVTCDLNEIPECWTVTILPYLRVRTAQGNPIATVCKTFDSKISDAIDNPHIQTIRIAREFGYAPPRGGKVEIISGPYSVPNGFERFFEVLPNTGAGLFKWVAARSDVHGQTSIIYR